MEPLSLKAVVIMTSMFGGFVSSYGVMVPFFVKKFEISIATVSSLFAIAGFGAITGVLISTFLVDKIPAKFAGSLGTVGIAIGVLVISFASDWNLTLRALWIIGFSNSFTQVAISQYLTSVGGVRASRRITFNNTAFALGSIVFPLLIGSIINQYFDLFLYIFAIVIVLVGLTYFKNVSGHLNHIPNPNRNTREWVTILFILLGLTTYVGAEISATGWIPTLLEAQGYSSSAASLGTTVYFIFLFLGRLFFIRFIHKVNLRRLTLQSSYSMLPALLIFQLMEFKYLGIALLGLTSAVVFPTGMSWIIRLVPGNARIVGIIFTFSVTGGLIFPSLTGLAISRLGSEYTPLILMIPVIASILFFTIAVRTSREKFLIKV
ncbi:MAG: MFS transporter [Candidatus Nanopelagicales bacterium]|jgi:fucose permease